MSLHTTYHGCPNWTSAGCVCHTGHAAFTDAPTPRTDNEDHWFVDRDESGLLGVDTVRADFARDLERDLAAMRDVLLRNGFVECDIAACNCGSWHARYGLPERMAEIKDALAEAGHPLCNENGNLVRNALAELIAKLTKCSPVASREPSVVDVLAERRRQIEREGWTPEHDDVHFGAELSKAAGCYVHHANYGVGKSDYTEDGVPRKWPWAARWWKPKDRRRDLVKAAALILAEIDRLDRAAANVEKGE